jgi:phosphate transport system permease protein
MSSSANSIASLQPSGRKLRQQRLERVVFVILSIIAASGVLITTGVVVALVGPTIDFFREVRIGEFLGSTRWYPLYEPPEFGVWPLVVGTFFIMLIAVIIAVPGGLAIAFFLAEYASPRTRRILKPLLEILAGIPTVVFGFLLCTLSHRISHRRFGQLVRLVSTVPCLQGSPLV